MLLYFATTAFLKICFTSYLIFYVNVFSHSFTSYCNKFRRKKLLSWFSIQKRWKSIAAFAAATTATKPPLTKQLQP